MRDYNNTINSAKDIDREEGHAHGLEEGIAQGREEGHAQGLEHGIAQGREEGILQVARAMKSRGASDIEIAAVTFLPLEQIKKLKTSN